MKNTITVTLENNQTTIIPKDKVFKVYSITTHGGLTKTVIEYINGKLDTVLETVQNIEGQLNS
jgi:hypothetical protein